MGEEGYRGASIATPEQSSAPSGPGAGTLPWRTLRALHEKPIARRARPRLFLIPSSPHPLIPSSPLDHSAAERDVQRHEVLGVRAAQPQQLLLGLEQVPLRVEHLEVARDALDVAGAG